MEKLTKKILSDSIGFGVGASVVGKIDAPANIKASANAAFNVASISMPLASTGYVLGEVKKLKKFKV